MPILSPCKAAKASDVLEARIATHDYVGQDDDELTFKKGDMIDVIPFADPEDDVRCGLDDTARRPSCPIAAAR